MELGDKRFLLTGASGGLGRAIAEQMAEAGAKLVLSSRKQKELREIGKSLPGGLRRHKTIVADLAQVGAAEKLIADAPELDGMVANAALPASGALESFTHTELTRALRVNLESPIQMTRDLVPRLLEKGEGHVVFISSLAGEYAPPRSSVYSATKFGLRGFAFGLREDLRASDVGISVVSPGIVKEAGMYADSGADLGVMLGGTTPGKVGKAVVKAIRRDRSEVFVAPFRQRRLNRFAGHHHEMAGRLVPNRRAIEMAEEVTSGQTEKR